MKTVTIIVGTFLSFGGLNFVHSSPTSGSDTEPRKDEAVSSASISSSVNGRNGTVVYNSEKVWEGRVRNMLTAIAEDLGGKYGACAAAWDGKKLLWENKPGAAAKLRPKLNG